MPEYAQSNGHLYHLLCPTQAKRDELLQSLREQGVEASFHFIPLHSSPMSRRLGYGKDELPVTEEISRRLIRLPIYPDLSEDEQAYVIEKVQECLTGW